ncbi:MAG TPA: TetR/AcrR family transcriptional regulator [Streptosporangiaceae bacterium]|jgi:AcrR family transcriptional regulator
MATKATTPRQRARQQTIRDIKRIARRQLATEGTGALSLRAIARELGIVSSAIYRYVPSRDELLTMLIVDAYDGLGEAVEKAEAKIGRGDHSGRWAAIGRAVRQWAVTHPEEYGLIYGSPVPGYKAPPERTVGPGSRVSLLILRLVTDAHAAGEIRPPGRADAVPAAVAERFPELRAQLATDLSDDLIVRLLLAWTSVFGLVSFELGGQYVGVVDDTAAHFDHQLAVLGRDLGL